MNLTEGAALFTNMAARYEAGVHDALDRACLVIEDEAKRVIGTYEYGWEPLKPETIDRKVTGDSPLLETGEMRDSIQHNVEGKSGHVGSDNDKAVWQELGTSRITPRSFLAGAAMHKGQEAAHEVGNTLFEFMNGRGTSLGTLKLSGL